MSEKQTKYVSIDALNHVIEAATSTVASPYSITLAKQVIELVAKYLPKAIENPDDLEARYFLAYAAMMGGVSFDNGLLHYTHALEHPLSAVKPEYRTSYALVRYIASRPFAKSVSSSIDTNNQESIFKTILARIKEFFYS